MSFGFCILGRCHFCRERLCLVVPLGNGGIKSDSSIPLLESIGFGLQIPGRPEWHSGTHHVVGVFPRLWIPFVFRRARTTTRNAFLGVDQVVCVLSVHRYGIADRTPTRHRRGRARARCLAIIYSYGLTNAPASLSEIQK